MHNKDISIATQVAFNTTVGLYDPASLLTDEGVVAFTQTLDVLSDALLSKIVANVTAHGDPEPTKTTVSMSPSQAQASIEANFAGTTSEPYSVEVIDKQGDLPDWAVAAFAKDQIRKVFDNRASRDPDKNQPYFREAGGQKRGYWPPKAGARK